MKRKLLLMPLLALMLGGCTPKNPGPTPESITIINIAQTTELVIGDIVELYTSVLPQTANQSVVWSSSDSAVATVSDGRVEAISEGNVTLKAVSAVLNTVEATLDFEVLASQLLPTSITLSAANNNPTVAAGLTLALSATINPTGARYHELLWSSLDVEVATVSASGVVTGVSSGETSIVAEAVNKSGKVLAASSITIHVVEGDWIVNTIAKIYDERTEVNSAINVVGKVMVSNSAGVVIADNDDAVLVYQPKYDGDPAVVGDIVNLTGNVSIFNASAQIIAATISVITTDVPVINGPALINNYSEASLKAYMAGIYQDDISGKQKLLVKPLYVEVKALTAVLASNNFIDLYLENGTVNFSIKGSTFRNDLKEGDKVDFCGYITGIEQALDHSFPRIAIYAVEGSQTITKA